MALWAPGNGDRARDDEPMGTALPERAAAALLGLACGDALGSTVEFLDREEICRRYPGGLRDVVGGGVLGLAPGETSDDTAMAVAVLAGLARALGGLPSGQPDRRLRPAELTRAAESVGEAFASWFRAGPKGVGATTRRALSAYLESGSWEQAQGAARAGLGHAVGNGALMRTLPVAFFWPGRPGRAVPVARAVARLTHPHPDAEWSAALYTAYAALLLAADPLASPSGTRKARLWNGARRALGRAAPDLARHAAGELEARFRYARLARLPEDAVRAGRGTLDAFEAALWAFFTTDDFEPCVVRAANLGDDADTVAALAGGLAGAAYGLAAIPGGWRRKVAPVLVRALPR